MSRKTSNFFQGLIVGSVLLALFTLLFRSESRIEPLFYVLLVTLSLLVGLIIIFRDEVREFDLRGMKVILAETQNIKEEINKTVCNLVELLAYHSSYTSGSWLNHKKLNESMDQLLEGIGVNKDERDTILEYPRLMQRFMKNPESLTEAERNKVDKLFELEETPE